MEFFALMLIPVALYMALMGCLFELDQKDNEEDKKERKKDEQER